MRRPRGSRHLTPALLALSLLTGTLLAGPTAYADPGTPPVPSQAEVDDAATQVDAATMDLDAVQSELAAAQVEVAAAADEAAQASEVYNGARWRAEQADRAADRQERRSAQAAHAAAEQRSAYADAVTSGVAEAPSLTALSSLVQDDGLTSMIDRTDAMRMAEDALGDRAEEADATSLSASAERTVAEQDRQRADRAAAEAETAHDRAQAAADAATARATSAEQRGEELMSRVAELQGVSVELATRRQDGLEQRSAARAEALGRRRVQAVLGDRLAAARSASQEAQETNRGGVPAGTPSPDLAEPGSESAAGSAAGSAPGAPTSDRAAPSSDGAAAVTRARRELGDPYVWAAVGPDSWDCSGLTMAAWAASGTSLPHYSVAQYEASTPIRPSELQPGDLLFWGDTSSPGSIFHVALYSGDGMMIHAPRTGRDVVEESMYYWRLPDFYARP